MLYICVLLLPYISDAINIYPRERSIKEKATPV